MEKTAEQGAGSPSYLVKDDKKSKRSTAVISWIVHVPGKLLNAFDIANYFTVSLFINELLLLYLFENLVSRNITL